jgi:hypothetical protein
LWTFLLRRSSAILGVPANVRIPVAVRTLHPYANLTFFAACWAGECLAQTVGWCGFQILDYALHLLHYAALNHLEILPRYFAAGSQLFIHLVKLLVDFRELRSYGLHL